MLIDLRLVPKSDPLLKGMMPFHYSQPRSFVARSLCYQIWVTDVFYGCIVGGSATKHLPGRDKVFPHHFDLQTVASNTFFHCFKVNGKYPARNFTTAVVLAWEERIALDWKEKYGDPVLFYETLVELPRSGELYRRAGYTEVGVTKGFTCKRTGGKGSDSWGGQRVWDTENLRPKLVFCKVNKTGF